MQVIRCFKNVIAQRNIKSSAHCSLKRRLERHAKNIKDSFEEVLLHVANARGNKLLWPIRRSS